MMKSVRSRLTVTFIGLIAVILAVIWGVNNWYLEDFYVTKKVQLYVNSDARMDARKQLLLMAMDITSELFDMRRRHARYKELYLESQKVAGVLCSMLEDELAKISSNDKEMTNSGK